jgi:hypothetical protein
VDNVLAVTSSTVAAWFRALLDGSLGTAAQWRPAYGQLVTSVTLQLGGAGMTAIDELSNYVLSLCGGPFRHLLLFRFGQPG